MKWVNTVVSIDQDRAQEFKSGLPIGKHSKAHMVENLKTKELLIGGQPVTLNDVYHIRRVQRAWKESIRRSKERKGLTSVNIEGR